VTGLLTRHLLANHFPGQRHHVLRQDLGVTDCRSGRSDADLQLADLRDARRQGPRRRTLKISPASAMCRRGRPWPLWWRTCNRRSRRWRTIGDRRSGQGMPW